MKEFTVKSYEITKEGFVVFICEDLLEDAEVVNFCKSLRCFDEQKHSAREYQVSYNLNDAIELNLLFNLRKTYAPESKDIKELITSIAAIGMNESKPIPAYWSKDNHTWYFRY